MNEKNEDTPSPWIDSEDLDERIDETCHLYGIDKLECITSNTKENNTDDADSIVSEDSGKEAVTLQDRINSQLFIVRETTSGQILWKCPLQDSDTIADNFVALKALSYRLPCHSFRSMLPALKEGDRPPVRSPTWIRHCMIGVLFSALQSYAEERASSLIHIVRIHFPEHAYAWFSNEEDFLPRDEKGVERLAKEDEDRWAFYHGVKGLSNCDSLGWIVYQLLDDLHGEDFFSFFSDAMDMIQKEMGQSFDQFSENSVAKAEFEDKYIWVLTTTSHEIIYRLFYGDWIKSSAYTEALTTEVDENAMDMPNSTLPVLQTEATLKDIYSPCIELYSFVQMLLKMYLKHMVKQMIQIRLMIDTSSTCELTDYYNVPTANQCDKENALMKGQSASFVDFCKIIKSLWPTVSLKEMTLLYRESYDATYPPSQWNKPAPKGISFDGFMVAAERRCFFSRARLNRNK